MSKLLSAGFIRLRKDKIFWIALIFMFGAGVFFPVMRYIDMQKSGYINNIDNGFFACALFIVLSWRSFAVSLLEQNIAMAQSAIK